MGYGLLIIESDNPEIIRIISDYRLSPGPILAPTWIIDYSPGPSRTPGLWIIALAHPAHLDYGL